MASHSQVVKHKLMTVISDMSSCKEIFVRNPGKDFSRNRKLSFKDLMIFMLSMGGSSINKELVNHFGFNSNVVSASAFVQQRDKLLPEAFKYLLHKFTRSFDHYKTYQGYRLIAIDGSDLHIPLNPKDSQTYYQTAANCRGYNLIHINAMYDLCNKIYLDACIEPSRKQNEVRALTDMVDKSTLDEKNVIIIADRGFENFSAFAHIEKKGWKYLIRVKDINSNGILSCLGLPDKELDQMKDLILTHTRTKAVMERPDLYKFVSKRSNFDYLKKTGQTYYPINFRMIRIELDDKTFQSFITNLDPEVFTASKISEIYRMRWGIETSFRELKHTLGLTSLHSKKMECIHQEIFARMVMYNFCEIITLHVIVKQKSRKHGYQINYSMAMSVCRHFLKTLEGAHPPDVEALIQKYILPIRQGRTHPRKIKTRSFVHFNYRIA